MLKPGTRPGLLPRLLPYVACVLIGLAAAQPLVTIGRLPKAADSLFHLHRLIEMDTLIHEGILFSRWAPDLARGFGYPLFNYYGPLSYYLPEALHLLGLPFVPALLGAFVLFVVIAALTMYGWARDLLGEGGAILAAAAYVLSPYLMINLLRRTVLAEVFGMALLPLIMFSLSRLLASGRRRYAALMSLSLAAVILGHNVTAALSLPFVALFVAVCLAVAWHTAPARGSASRRQLASSAGWAILAVLAALGLTAFFWLPALAERNLVQMDRLTAWPIFDYHFSFADLGRIFSLPQLEDLLLVNRSVPTSLSLPAALLALVGVGGIWRWRPSRVQAAQVGAAALAACCAVFLVTPASAPIWEAVPPLRFLQFVWRFLPIGNLFLALLTGAGFKAVEGHDGRIKVWKSVLLAITVCALFAWLFAWQNAAQFNPPLGSLAIDDVVRYERASGRIGTTMTGEYLPATVQKYPPPEPDTQSYDRARFDRASLPEGAQVVSADYQPLEYRLTFETPRPFVAVFNTFDFAGWHALIDGVEAQITPTEPYGLIGVAVPAGRHELRLAFGTTLVRVWGDAVSLLTAAVLAGLAALLLRHQRGRANSSQNVQEGEALGSLASAHSASAARPAAPGLDTFKPSWPSAGLAWATVGLVAIAFGIKSAYIDPHWAELLRKRFDIVSNADFSHQLTLLGADPPAAASSGGKARVLLYWRVRAQSDIEISPAAYLIDARGVVYAHADNQHPGGIPTTEWSTAGYVRDAHVFKLPAGMPPGRYTVHVGAYPYGKPNEALNVLDANGAPAGRSVALATLEVVRPARPPHEDELTMSTRLDRPLGAGLVLLGYDLPKRQVQTGQRLPLNLYWKAEQALGAGLAMQFQLLDEAGGLAYSQDVPPVPGYDTAQWRPGDIWRGAHILTIPAHLSGRYTLAVARPGEPAVALATLDVQAPAHVFTAPRTAITQSGTFGNLVSLAGHDVAGKAQPGQELTVTLAWRAERETSEQYKAFVHLLDADGRLITGSDTVPGDGQRPTSSWVAGEYITDLHRLQLPQSLKPGMYRLEVGFYDGTTLKRLPLSGSADALILSQALEVQP